MKKTLTINASLDVSDHSDPMVEAIKAYLNASLAPMKEQGWRIITQVSREPQENPGSAFLTRIARAALEEHGEDLDEQLKPFIKRMAEGKGYSDLLEK